MPVHDWAKLDAGMFHAYHGAWITHLMEALNGGLLPEGYYALAEQHFGRRIADVLTLHAPGSPGEPGGSPDLPGSGPPPPGGPALGLAEAPPRVGRRLTASPETAYRAARRTLTVRHVSGHRIVALIEVVSPGNKDRAANVEEFVDKIDAALQAGCHVLLVDLFRPGPDDPRGMHGALWERYDPQEYDLPDDRPLTLASYVAGLLPEAFVEHLELGSLLPEMPLFFRPDAYVPVPLEATYGLAHGGMPAFWLDVLEGRWTP
jgi:hypothetical protein